MIYDLFYKVVFGAVLNVNFASRANLVLNQIMYSHARYGRGEHDMLPSWLRGHEERRLRSREERVKSGYRQPADTPLIEVLTLVNPRYTQEVVQSCLADLTPIAAYETRQLLFHHASFPDYLLDQLRSRDYFVDTAVLYYKILPALWSLIGDNKWDFQRCTCTHALIILVI